MEKSSAVSPLYFVLRFFLTTYVIGDIVCITLQATKNAVVKVY